MPGYAYPGFHARIIVAASKLIYRNRSFGVRRKAQIGKMAIEPGPGKNRISPADNLKESFRAFSHTVAEKSGSPSAFLAALVLVVGWSLTGPWFRYSDTWQLVINTTTTTIVTFLMVFLIQNTQNRDTREIHLKLDELIRSHEPARNLFMNLEHLSDEELDELARRLGERASIVSAR